MAGFTELPADLPVPEDDGSCDHLPGVTVPAVPLPSTAGQSVELAAEPGLVVAYFYPMTGRPGVPPPDGWDAIPGARGCTPQACAFRDHSQDIGALGGTVYGVSAQRPEEQAEAAARLHLPFELLSDHRLALATALRLPVFEAAGRVLIKRLTLVLSGGRIMKVFYPVFPPDKHPVEVIDWLERHRA